MDPSKMSALPPHARVVGFKVEGVQPSPDSHHNLLHERKSVGAGSPTPVIIPPSFQPREPSSLSATRSAAPETVTTPKAGAEPAATSGSNTPGAPANPTQPPSPFIIPLLGVSNAAGTPSASTATTPGGGRVSPPALPSPGLAAPPPQTIAASLPLLSSTLSQPQAILQPKRAEAGHVGLQRPNSPSAESASTSVTSGVSTAMFRTDESQYAPSNLSPGRVVTSPVQLQPHQHQHQHQHQHHGHHQAADQVKQPAKKATAAAPPPGTPTPTPSAPPAPIRGLSDVSVAESLAKHVLEKKSQKEMTRGERRALQESQKAAKAAAAQTAGGKGGHAAGGSGGASKAIESRLNPKATAGTQNQTERPSRLELTTSAGGASVDTPPHVLTSTSSTTTKLKKQQGSKVVSLSPTEMFAHLQQFKKVSMETLMGYKDVASMHPEVVQLGLRYADGTITGANARCIAMLDVFCKVIQDYSTPTNARLNRHLTSYLNNMVDFLVKCRPLALSMGNAIKWLKLRIAAISPEAQESEAKEKLVEQIQEFIRSRIEQAQVHVANRAAEKVEDGDVILTYAYSHIVAFMLMEARRPTKATASQGDNVPRSPPRQFRVIVVDSRPEREGLLMLQKLQSAGIACTYAHMNALSFVMTDVTKVFLGASAIMSNGTVMSRAGTAAVAMMAHAHSKPVLVCCESYKFHERVQLDAITHNELGDPDMLCQVEDRPDITAVKDWQNVPRLALLNLKYDAMPAQYVTAIVTDHALIPPSSVPVVIREMHKE